MLKEAQQCLSKVYKVLLDCNDDVKLSDVLNNTEVDYDEYVKALEVTTSGTVIVSRREPNKNINASVMLAWQYSVCAKCLRMCSVCSIVHNVNRQSNGCVTEASSS